MQQSSPRSLFQIVIILVKFLLIKIGRLPSTTIVYLLRILKKLSFQPSLLFKKHRLGRPRTRPFVVIYRHRLFHLINLIIPKKNRTIVAIVAFIVILISTAYISVVVATQLPNPNRLISSEKPLTTEFYDRNGKLLYRLYEGRNRTLVKIDELPIFAAQATIAIEDKNFYQHFGIDPIAMLRAFYHNVNESKLEGASTITQQLIKNSLLTAEKTYTRKIKEVVLAFWAERIYSKQEILQMYLNEAPYGGPAWGIEAAAQTYFGKSASKLDLAQSAYLAGLPASPTQFSPFGTQPELGKLRQKEVLRRMVEDGYIDQTQFEQASDEELNITPPGNNIKAPHFVMYVRDLLSQKYGPRVVSQGGLKIYTTLDLSLQEQSEKIVAEEIEELVYLNVKNGASMITDARTGQILSMVGSRDYHYPDFGNFNVTVAHRQPGSSIKPITYATAFKQGYSPGNTIIDSPITFKDAWGYTYTPVNYDGRFHGAVSIRTALGSSYNIPAVKLLQGVGLPAMIQTAKDLGITTFKDIKNYGLSLTLGAGEVRMIDMMSVYGTFAEMGNKRVPTPILKIVDSEGNIIEEYEDQSQEVIQPEIAYLITDILSDNRARTPAFGSNSLLYFNQTQVAVKTGTSDSKRDNWTFGYTPNYVVGAWVGNNDNTPMDPQLASGITGAAPIWYRIMQLMLQNTEVSYFSKPAGIIDINVDGRKDLAITGITPKGLVQKMRPKKETFKINIDTSAATPPAQQ